MQQQLPEALSVFIVLDCSYIDCCYCVLQIRWYSFQFAMQQLSEALSDAFDAMAEVLPSLPAEVARRESSDLD